MSAAIDYRDRAASLTYRNKAFIDGKFVDAASGETFECVSPVDGKLLTEVAACDKADVDVAVKAARRAFESGVWSEMNPKDRKKALLKFAGLIEKH
ncbi:MAG: aldehyde dehydrogenase family protein, partial [Parvibaculum sp.]